MPRWNRHRTGAAPQLATGDGTTLRLGAASGPATAWCRPTRAGGWNWTGPLITPVTLALAVTDRAGDHAAAADVTFTVGGGRHRVVYRRGDFSGSLTLLTDELLDLRLVSVSIAQKLT